LRNLDAYKLKWIAIIGMFFNHAVLALREVIPFGLQLPLFAIGGVTFPIMAFLVIEGYKHTSNLKKYLLRIFVFALIAQVPYMWALRDFARLNIMFTIFVGLLLMLLYDSIKKPITKHLIFWPVFAVALVVSFWFDWMIVGLIIMIMYHLISNEKRRRVLPPIIIGVFYILSGAMSVLGYLAYGDGFGLGMYSLAGRDAIVVSTFFVGVVFSAFLLKGYNSKRGKSMKYFFYLFYPLHFVILGLIAYALGYVGLPFAS